MKPQKKLNIDKLSSRMARESTSEKALRNIKSMNFSEDSKVIVEKPQK